MDILLLRYLGILFLKLNNVKCAKTAEKNCSELLNYKHQVGENVIGTMFEYSLPYNCFICTKKKTSVRRESVFDVYLYNNLLDFGFSGIYFPSEFNAQIRMTEHCFLQINFKSNKKTQKIRFNIEMCVNASESVCSDTGYSSEKNLVFNNWYCFYIALAFVEENKIHIAISIRCQYIASRFFSDNKVINITNEKCVVDINKNELHASITTEMSEDYAYDGYPIILPCSPGGYAADPYTGKFLIDDRCYRHFPGVSRNIETDGINFLINKVYSRNENLFFPIKAKKPYDVHPTYIHKISGQPYPRNKMKVKNQRKVLKGNRKRIDCNYEAKEKKISNFPPCEDLFIDNIIDKPKKDSINYYVHRNGCFLCSHPTCDFNDTKCNRTSVIKNIPLYNNIIGFGIPALHFPQETILKIKINSECYFKAEVKRDSQNVTMIIYECVKFNLTDKCTQSSSKHDFLIDLNNYYCVHLSTSFRSRNMIHITTSNLCNKFATTEYKSKILTVKDESCSFFQKNYKYMADYEFKHHNSNTHSGIPLLVPCSTGGVAVDPRTGRFTSGPSCRKMVWEADQREKGLLYVIEKFYKSNEDYLFMTESEAELKHPWPVYIKKDKTFISFEKGIPKIVPNKENRNKYRQGCYFIEETSTEETLPFGPPLVTIRTTRRVKWPFKRLSIPKRRIVPEKSKGCTENCNVMFFIFICFVLNL